MTTKAKRQPRAEAAEFRDTWSEHYDESTRTYRIPGGPIAGGSVDEGDAVRADGVRGEGAQAMMATGELLMNGTTVEWPPRDMNGKAIGIGARVYGVRDTFNGAHQHAFTCGGLRLQNQGGCLAWVVCAYDDDGAYYFEAYAEDCAVIGAAPELG